MSDNKSARNSPDNKRIDINDPNEVRHWSESLGISAEKLKQLVARVGTSAEKVREAAKS
jgi:methyl-accepting chemotaxis protein